MSSDEGGTWITRFCVQKENIIFCEVDANFFKNEANLTGLSEQVPHYREALNMILDAAPGDAAGDKTKHADVESASKHLYGLAHARYIVTDDGLAKSRTKYLLGEFGRCGRMYCHYHPMLPVDYEDDGPYEFGVDPVKLFCPKCVDIYIPLPILQRKIKGAYFARDFPELFYAVFPQLKRDVLGERMCKLFGLSPSAPTGRGA